MGLYRAYRHVISLVFFHPRINNYLWAEYCLSISEKKYLCHMFCVSFFLLRPNQKCDFSIRRNRLCCRWLFTVIAVPSNRSTQVLSECICVTDTYMFAHVRSVLIKPHWQLHVYHMAQSIDGIYLYSRLFMLRASQSHCYLCMQYIRICVDKHSAIRHGLLFVLIHAV